MFIIIVCSAILIIMFVTKRNILQIYSGSVFPHKDEYPLGYWTTIITLTIILIYSIVSNDPTP